MARKRSLHELVLKAIILGIQRNGDRVFSTSQNTDACFVPVDKGTLKRSGFVEKLPRGIRIGYTAPYAARVHSGGPAIPFKGTQVIHVGAHKRKGYEREDGVYVDPVEVRSHDRTYVDKRVVAFRPKYSKFERGPLIFRVLKEEPARKGTFFLTRALAQEIQRLPEDIEFYLRRLEKTGTV